MNNEIVDSEWFTNVVNAKLDMLKEQNKKYSSMNPYDLSFIRENFETDLKMKIVTLQQWGVTDIQTLSLDNLYIMIDLIEEVNNLNSKVQWVSDWLDECPI